MSQTAFVLVVTPEQSLGDRIRELLRDRHGHSCRVVASLGEALDSIRARAPDVVAVCGHDEPAEGLDRVVAALEAVALDATLLLAGRYDAPSTRRIRVATLPDGDDPVALARAISAAAGKAVSRRADRELRESIEQRPAEYFHGIVGVSSAIRKVVERVQKAARNKATVLILGETGTGKDLIAEAIHRASDRARGPFKAINCAGLNENLLESELFGHVRGAFTGAVGDRKGYFVAADGGTLLLDEIGDMPLPMQPKLLRALDRREITPVGSTEVRRVDVRLIAATNANLQQLMEDRKFREDLFFRLHEFVIEIPPLRERRDDIPFLVDHFRRKANELHGLACPGVSSEAMGLLTKYFWPGNVRELASVISALVIDVEDRQIEADDLPERIRGSREIVPASSVGLVGLKMAQIERMMIERTLQATGGNREQAAKILGIGTRTLYRKLKEFGL